MKYLKLNTGMQIPIIGIGTLQPISSIKDSISLAIDIGYRHIDTATFYKNYSELRKALVKYENIREELFITSKVWKDSLDYKSVIKDCENTLENLSLKYLDSYLIHRPNKDYPLDKTYKALNELVNKGLVRNIGVSNFNFEDLNEVLGIFNKNPISIIQDEFNPYFQDTVRADFCIKNSLIYIAYSPFSNGKIFNDKRILEISKSQNIPISKMVLSWVIEKGLAVIPMSSKSQHITDNLDIFNFDLDEKIISSLNSLNINQRCRNYH